MAFRQPQQRPPVSRQLSLHVDAQPAEVAAVASSHRKRSLEESEEWVLFSPGTAQSVKEKTQTTSTERTPRTAALSRLSDFGSLDTAADVDDLTEHGTEPDEETDLDSLDDGLHAFHEPSDYSSHSRARIDQSGGPVVPTHDGLGAFGDGSAAMQQQLWQFEQCHEPARKVRRTSSVQRTLDALQEAEEMGQEGERMRRIENWRLEQSRALLEEIERETRRMRRMGRSTAARSRADMNASIDFVSAASRSTISQHTTHHDANPDAEETESFWQRFTQKVIRNLIGIDENLLSIILGEALPDENQTQSIHSDPGRSIAYITSLEDRDAHVPIEETWQHRLLQRIARELGLLVHQLSEHPGAFGTYLRTQEVPAYAGLPDTQTPAWGTTSDPAVYGFTRHSAGSLPDVVFHPTVPAQQHGEASLWGIEEEPDESYGPRPAATPSEEAARLAQEQEYWERELDVKMVFNFLKSRFSSRPASPTPPDIPPPAFAPRSVPADTTTEQQQQQRGSFLAQAPSVPASARRAALIRQHHPLTSRNLETSSRRHHVQPSPSQPQTTGVAAALLRHRIAGRPGSSCASVSTKKSKRSGSSRNYWDIGGSVGTGPASIGVWGEVGV